MRTKKELHIILLAALVMCAIVLKFCEAGVIISIFEDTVNTDKFNHLIVDKRTGRVYIGAVNRLYQLSADLKLQVSEKMGPKDDNPDCPVNQNCPAVIKKPTDYVNKALLIDYVNSTLITCGSLFQGVCQLRSLENISFADEPVKEAIVANNATASTVAFIAPGPPNSATTSVIYVGATYTGNGPYRAEVPAMSSRSLDSSSLFQFASQSVTTGTRMFVSSLARDSYPITYVYGFSSEGFSYFISIQKKAVDESSHYISKLIRLCHNDQHYYSHTEVPLECKFNNTPGYNLIQAAYLGKPGSELAVNLGINVSDDVLFAVFSKSHWENNLKPSTESALCIYPLKDIRHSFMENIKNCFSGHGDRGLDFINPSVKCQKTLIPINDNFCGTDVNTPLGGKTIITIAPAITYPYDILTAVASVSTHDYTVVFLGTANGALKKVVVESRTNATEYGNLTVNRDSPVNPDLRFDRNETSLYIMTERRISRVRVQECGKYNTCTECLGSKDPYCGWCSLENKCKLRSECATVEQDPLYWLSYKSGKCTIISKVEPNQIQRTTARKLTLTIENLPSLLGQFLCVFTVLGKTMITNATRSAVGVTCPTPRTDELPAIPNGEHHFVARLSVRIKVEPEFVATNFTFYDCFLYTSCTSCVSSPFPCYWCVEGHRCTHNTGDYCRKDYLITGVSSLGNSNRSGPSFCPRINSTSKEILVSSGMSHNVTVQAINIQPFQGRFHCQFNMEGRIKQAAAHLSGETITCDPYLFSYASFSPNSTATFAVVWSGNKPLDNPDFIHLTVYKCTAMASNCGLCLELDPKFNCGWCESMCHVKSQCNRNWLNRSATCPDPQIVRFYPTTGPWEGGTELTIEGINLGKTFDDIKNGVMVASIPCEPIEEQYDRTSKIVCRTDTIGNNVQVSGRVVVKVNDYEGKSAFNFTYVDPKIRDISPTKGPKSGGTKVTISGEYMNAGSNITMSIGGNPCHIINKYPTEVVCLTSGSASPQNGSIVMQFDKGRRFFTSKLFYYSEDPTITRVASSASSNRDGPKGIPSGGILISVEGTNLDSIQEPKMAISWHGKSYESPCDVFSPTEMRCRAPVLPSFAISRPEDIPLELDYGFIMDNVIALRNLTSSNFKSYLLYPDPIYKPFPEKDGIKYYKSDYLTINGENLDGGCKEMDVVVQIGSGYCNVTSLSTKQLTCRPPTTQPPALDLHGHPDDKNIPQVVVMVGLYLNYTIGYLSYETQTIFESGLPKHIIIGITVGGGILLIIVVMILIAYRRKSTESSRVLKNMQEQMDVLELRVASECKEAFAELQTEMTDFTNDLSASGIPFLDYRTYSMKVLFPNVDDHPVLRDTLETPLKYNNKLENERITYNYGAAMMDPSKKTHIEKGLRLFGQLIMNKTFLLLFIRTLESNRYFSMRDRVNVASLIMVTLQGKMEYCTDILKTLLAELIERCLEGRSHPKLLLRRTESVAEKMLSAWFTFLLYKFLRECAGEPLFLLYRAIKQQVDKGPVDAITSEARYSLSEEKLIRQQIEYKSMTVYVSGLEPQTENIETPVKVLDCDIISQVKEKALDAIYKNTPYSQRPSKEDLDLVGAPPEWRTGNTGRLILQDEDMTTKPESEWKRLNTLAHYKVPDIASLTLVPKQSSMYNMSIISDRSEKSHKFAPRGNQPMAVWAIQENFAFKTSSSPPPSRATSPMNHDLDTGYKLWHLVKQHDADASKEGERGNKMVSEIYLTRLLATKGTLQKFVDDLFETIFSTAHRGSALPLAIKYMFDFLDDQALQHGISDPEVVHTWKSNSLPLRFWVNLIKNPNFVFDINKSNIVDSCLSVVAQTFMDSCSTSDHRLGKDSPSSKLLYAKDIPVYRDWVDRYYQDIKLMPAISDQDMNAMLAEESRLHQKEFNVNSAVHELYKYAAKYNDQLIQTLEEDEFSKKNRLAYKLEQIHHIMSGESEA